MSERRTMVGRPILAHAALLCFLALSACSDPTELLLIVKAGPGLTFGPTQDKDISILDVRVQLIDSDRDQWFYTRSVNLCPLADAPGVACRPQKFADKNYDGSLTLPIRLLFQPGSLGLVKDSRVRINALAADGTTVVLSGAVRFRFSDGHRLWLEIPLFKQCLNAETDCSVTDQICGIDSKCKTEMPSTRKPGDADDPAVGDMTIVGDLSSGDPGDMTLPPGVDLSTSGVVDFSSPTDLSVMMMSQDFAVSPLDLSASMDSSFSPADAAVCGNPGQACCGGSTCLGNGLQPVECMATKCVACGKQGDPCCANNLCVSGACVTTTTMGDGGPTMAATMCM